ncbi:MAG: peptide chain release factor 3 [Candidatus Cloacimonadota bacterium]|nr:MAG: peptide chain release factor 3 [Candidatus Cloacimonadota bacterium]PIE78147.1 MAG: peptide chain release factor 3 [Candidatus Delongbacteria bacterium]
MSRLKEINRRKTFAIVSHPDAGKTTLTEKLLLFGGAIREAGAVKSNKIKKGATSDFMEIERQRGISVASSVMGFEYKDYKVNILDTPGHKDFAEDTYRTLTAADSVIVVIDVAKGVEEQTEKLVNVCKMRNTPIIVFINKIDRPGKDSFELLDEIELKLGIKVSPFSWPVGMGEELKGVYNLRDKNLKLFKAHQTQDEDSTIVIDGLDSDLLDEHIYNQADKLREDVEMVEGVYPEFNLDDYLNGEISPLFFGSALNNFGVKELLECFLDIAPKPLDRETDTRVVKSDEEKFSGFVFKIHANIDPNHRMRIAFLRVVSGVFERNKNYHHVRLNRKLKFSNPTSFMAQKKETIENAYPGDIVGIPDTGNFKIGDTLTEGESFSFKGIPSFSPELFKYVENTNPLKTKQLNKGIDQLMEEGVAQLFTKVSNNRKVIGTVGELQYEVIQYRLEHEYQASCRFESISLYKACWISSDDESKLKEFIQKRSDSMAKDRYGNDVFLAQSPYKLQMVQDNYPEINFHFTSECR